MMTTLAFLAGVGTSLAVLHKVDPESTERLSTKVREGAQRTFGNARDRAEHVLGDVRSRTQGFVEEARETRTGNSVQELLAKYSRDPRALGIAAGVLGLVALKKLGLVGLVATGGAVALALQASKAKQLEGEGGYANLEGGRPSPGESTEALGV